MGKKHDINDAIKVTLFDVICAISRSAFLLNPIVITKLMRKRSVMEGEGGGSGMTPLFDADNFTDFAFLDDSKRTRDSIYNVILTIVEIGVPLHDLSKQASKKHTIRWLLIGRQGFERPFSCEDRLTLEKYTENFPELLERKSN
ncbi:hypothetical protein Tco_0214200 [Tanacetum coccineum]